MREGREVKWLVNQRRMLLYQLKAARQHLTRLDEGPVDGRRSTREERLDAVNNLERQEFKRWLV